MKNDFKIPLFIILLLLSFAFSFETNINNELTTAAMESERDLLNYGSDQIYQKVDFPRNLSKMTLAYTMVYPDDKIPRITLDSIGFEKGNILIYRPDENGETAKLMIDIK